MVALRLAGDIDLSLIAGDKLLDPPNDARRPSVDSLLEAVASSVKRVADIDAL